MKKSLVLSAEVVAWTDATKFPRLKKFSVMAYKPVKPSRLEFVCWGEYDSLLGAVTRFNSLTEYEKKTAYIMKNVVWKIEASEIDSAQQ